MNFHRVGILARKDLAEIRGNRYLLMSVAIPPIIFAVIFPLTAIGIIAQAPAPVAPLALHPATTVFYANESIAAVALTNASVERSTVTTGVITGSIIGNSTLSQVVVIGSLLFNVTLVNCSVLNSNLYGGALSTGTVLTNSAQVGVPSPREMALAEFTGIFEFFLILTPVVVPSAMASYTVVGEKTSKSLEPLLATPLTDEELLWGKAIAIFAATMAATWASFLVFQGILTIELPALVGLPFDPGVSWYLLMLLVAPLACLLAIAVNIMVSARVNDARTSQQVSGVVLLPVLGIILVLGLGLVAGGPLAVLGLVLILGVADFLLFRLASRLFGREEILARWK